MQEAARPQACQKLGLGRGADTAALGGKGSLQDRSTDTPLPPAPAGGGGVGLNPEKRSIAYKPNMAGAAKQMSRVSWHPLGKYFRGAPRLV